MFDSVSFDAKTATQSLDDHFQDVRLYSLDLVKSLSEADVQLQAMADVSPAKWHLAHTTWFFETFILKVFVADYTDFEPSYQYLFNSYYNSVGEQYPRHQRGLISRPSLSEVVEYRHWVDAQITALLANQSSLTNDQQVRLSYLMTLGLQHEQQHQELLLTDIQYNFFQNPSFPHYTAIENSPSSPAKPLQWLPVDSGLHTVGQADTHQDFSFDNERPEHRVFIEPFEMADRLVTNAEYLAFIESGAYQDPQYWLADGWAWLQTQHYRSTPAPLYWVLRNNQWFEFTLAGLKTLDPHAPVAHVNYYEATAYANWCDARLPTEFEWEVAAKQYHAKPAAEPVKLHPSGQANHSALSQMFDQVWQWTTSTYGAYPGFTPFAGNAGEYNGKFMSNQYVLRGSSCVTPKGHARTTYRNFFYAHQAWQFMGIRLAR